MYGVHLRWLACIATLCFVATAPAAELAPDRVDRLQPVLAFWDRDARADLKAVVVMRKGRIIAERYYNGDDAQTLHDIRSAGKSVTSLLVGAAIDRGRIGSVSDRVDAYLSRARGQPVGDATLAELLTMRSGLDANDEDPKSPGNEDRMDEAGDPLAFALAVPRRAPAGRQYVYNSLTTYLTGVAVSEAVGMPLDTFAKDVLFEPLGIRRWRWTRDASGQTKGQGNLSLTARDFARIGQMVLDKGNYAGHRVLSERWIAASLAPRVAISAVDPYADHYGYFWYSKTQRIDGRAIQVHFASGNGGNKIYIVPELDLIVAITSSAYGRGYGQRRSQDILRALMATLTRPREK